MDADRKAGLEEAEYLREMAEEAQEARLRQALERATSFEAERDSLVLELAHKDQRIEALEERDRRHERRGKEIERLHGVIDERSQKLSDAMNETREWRGKFGLAESDRKRLYKQMQDVYEERNLVVLLLAALAECFPRECDRCDQPSGLVACAWRQTDHSQGTDGFQTVVFVEIAGKQMSWHIPTALDDLASSLQPYEETDQTDPPTLWDGHSTEEKYERVRELIRTL